MALRWRRKRLVPVVIRHPAHPSRQRAEFHVESRESVLVPWPDSPLQSREQVTVQVAVTGRDGSTTEWFETRVEAALLLPSDWIAKVVTGREEQEDGTKTPLYFRKRFDLSSTIGSARLYITALGLYKVEINGKPVGDQVLAPGWQSYEFRHALKTYDISALLQPGENEVTATVGEGWWAGRLGFQGGKRNIWGSRLGLLAQLEMDGETVLHTDETWAWTTGKLVKSEIYDGEVLDTTKSLGEWTPVEMLPFPQGCLTSTQAPPIRRTREVPAVEIIRTPAGKTVIDYGQNLVGWLRWNEQFDGTGTVTIRHAEVMEHGELGVRPLRICKATDTVVLGGPTKGYEPSFTFHGFRYAEIDGIPHDTINLEDFTAIVVHTDFERTGTFDSSHKLVNQLYSNVCWGMRGNFLSVPTNCPQRDGSVCSHGVLPLGFGGGVPPVVVPSVFMRKPLPPGAGPSFAVWGDVASITPYDLFQAFGDDKFLSDQYESMTTWLDEDVRRGSNGTGLWDPDNFQLGDWLDPKAPPDSPADGQTDTVLVADAFLIHSTRLVAKASAILGHKDKTEAYSRDAQRLLEAFHREYVTPSDRLMSDSQCAYVLALWFDLAKDSAQASRWAERLVFLIKKKDFTVGTGFAGTPLILGALAKHGKLQIAYRMLQEGKCPSWLYPVTMGAATMWERWDSMLSDGSINPGEMTSFNHYAFGAVANFLHNTIGGLSTLDPGWKRFLVRPQPGGSFTHARSSLKTPYGLASCQWRLNEDQDKLLVTAVVPPNSSAQISLPGIDTVVGSGIWTYDVPWKKDEEWPPKIIHPPFTQRPPVPDPL